MELSFLREHHQELVPLLQSTLDDFDAEIRINAVRCFPLILPLLPPFPDGR